MTGPDDASAELVAAHVAGRLPPPMEALIAAHVAASARARRFADDLERLAAREIETAPPRPLGDRDAALARIFAEEAPIAAPTSCFPMERPRPSPLWFAVPPADAPWKRLWFGIETLDLGVHDGHACGFMRIGGGRRVPEHGHGGIEATLVLTGGFSDGAARFGPGDLHVCDETIEHAPMADPEGCLCAFVLAGDNVRPSSALGRLWMRLIG